MLFKYILIWFLACQQLGASPVALQDTEPYLLVIFTFIVTLLMPADPYSSGNLMPAVVCVCDEGKQTSVQTQNETFLTLEVRSRLVHARLICNDFCTFYIWCQPSCASRKHHTFASFISAHHICSHRKRKLDVLQNLLNQLWPGVFVAIFVRRWKPDQSRRVMLQRWWKCEVWAYLWLANSAGLN